MTEALSSKFFPIDLHLHQLITANNWDDAITFCDELCTGIQRAAVAGSAPVPTYLRFCDLSMFYSMPMPDPSLAEWLRFATTELFYEQLFTWENDHKWGRTSLHAAVKSRSPLRVVEALFRVERVIRNHDETVVARVPLWLLPSNDDSNPFHSACSNGAEVAVLQRYLDEVDYYIKQNWADSSCARMLVLQPNDQGITPFMGLFSYHLELFYFHRSLGLDHDGHLQLATRRAHGELLQLATRMVWFATRHIYPEYLSPSDPMLLHRCALIAPYFPVIMMEWILHLSGDTLDGNVSVRECAATQDDRGRSPLHNAIDAMEIPSFYLKIDRKGTQVARAPLQFLFGGTRHKLNVNRCEIIEMLLRWYPQAAGEPFPNGRSPLCEAVARGGTWYSRKHRRTSEDAAGLIQMLYNHAPDRLVERDTVTGMFPFMLVAATVPSLDVEQTEVLDTIYNLLRNDPQPIEYALRRSSTAV